ncbi:MAG TPA: carbohydrate kinase [Tepidisphaeraceae bacterium]|jgi:fructokinase|nr:carbohydrate kinase [Tepidisphaeraceae bacterium]
MNAKIIGLGEVLWDLLPTGRLMGGAPANFTCQARALGADANLISRVGDDDLGREILRSLTRAGINVQTVGVDPELPTGTVSVTLSGDGQPQFTINANAAWDRIDAGDVCLRAAEKCDAICFGTLAQRSAASRRAIMKILDHVPARALRILDVNLRPPFVDSAIIQASLLRANALKLNEHELPALAGMLGLTEASAAGQLRELGDRFGLRLIALTRGSAGSVLWSPDQVVERPGIAVNVVDSIGAGDAFTAAMTLAYLRGWDLDRINQFAGEVAAFACSHAGATTALDQYETFRRQILQ